MRKALLAAVAGAAVAAAVVGGFAWATIPAANGVIKACYQKNNGQLRVVDDNTACNSSELAISWNQSGPQGTGGGQGRDWGRRPTGADRCTRRDGDSGDPGNPRGPGHPGAEGRPGHKRQSRRDGGPRRHRRDRRPWTDRPGGADRPGGRHTGHAADSVPVPRKQPEPADREFLAETGGRERDDPGDELRGLHSAIVRIAAVTVLLHNPRASGHSRALAQRHGRR